MREQNCVFCCNGENFVLRALPLSVRGIWFAFPRTAASSHCPIRSVASALSTGAMFSLMCRPFIGEPGLASPRLDGEA